VVGDGAADDALVMIRAIDRFAKVKDGLAALSRIGDRRWDLIYYTGLRVQLPELGAGRALQQLQSYAERYALLDRDITLIDLRVAGIVTVEPTEFAAKQLAEAAKARMTNTEHHAVDASYETPAELATEVD
jgi:cell division protein FtsQ